MLNTQDITKLEKQWLKYKIKQKSRLYISMLLVGIVLFFVMYVLFLSKQERFQKEDKKSEIKKKELTVETKSYLFKLEPAEQKNKLFSSNGFLTLHLKYNNTEDKNQPIRKAETDVPKEKNHKQKISIDIQELDTISYLKDKYYSTSSIVFALMLAQEYYDDKEYKEALKWSLTANDIDSQNTKTWYWFAKSKVKLGKKEDAIRALKAYLSTNSSKRLSILLHKIELGDTDD